MTYLCCRKVFKSFLVLIGKERKKYCQNSSKREKNTVRTVLKSNKKIVERDKIENCKTQIHYHSLS